MEVQITGKSADKLWPKNYFLGVVYIYMVPRTSCGKQLSLKIDQERASFCHVCQSLYM